MSIGIAISTNRYKSDTNIIVSISTGTTNNNVIREHVLFLSYCKARLYPCTGVALCNGKPGQLNEKRERVGYQAAIAAGLIPNKQVKGVPHGCFDRVF